MRHLWFRPKRRHVFWLTRFEYTPDIRRDLLAVSAPDGVDIDQLLSALRTAGSAGASVVAIGEIACKANGPLTWCAAHATRHHGDTTIVCGHADPLKAIDALTQELINHAEARQ